MTASAATDIPGLARHLVDHVRTLRSVAVAWSGGVDSAVVAKAAVLALGDRAVAVTAVSASLASAELETARNEARAIGIRHLEIRTEEFLRDEYRRNRGDRCFYCKDTLYTLMAARASELGVSCLVNGANTDDLGDHRPGMQAASIHRVRSPLIELGIDKAHVRQLARHWGLGVAEKPAAPCLSSRIAYGVEVTEERVHRIEQAEAILRELTGLTEFRVRLDAGECARIEVPLAELPRFTDDTLRQSIVARFLTLGFRNIALDLQGFRSGSHNAALVELQPIAIATSPSDATSPSAAK